MIYLDNASTTKPSEKSLETVISMQKEFANASSLHSFGYECERKLEKAREILADSMGVPSETVYFTSGGTMSDNIAVRGFLSSKKQGRIITTEFEHPAVLECFKSLSQQFEVVYIKPNNGKISAEDVENVLSDDTVFVSVMHVNNETGAVNDIRNIASLLKERKIVFHTDAVQGFMKEQFKYSCVDMASFSGHKTHGPKGIGAVYIKKGVKVNPVIYGGGQEKNIHSGTINTVGACAWAAAVEELKRDQQQNYNRIRELNKKYRELVLSLGGEVISPVDGSPYILNVAFKGYLGENILHFLSDKEIYISTGSACSSKKGSHVLKSVGKESVQKNAIRLSFSENNTADEICDVADALKACLKAVKKVSK